LTTFVDGTTVIEASWLQDVNDLVYNVVAVPATATSAGEAGQIVRDANFLYLCIATDTWRRVAIAAW